MHQDITDFVYFAVKAILQRRGRGVVKFSPFKVQVAERTFREPDVCVLLDESDPRRGREYWAGADVVVEVVSRDKPQRDYEEKRLDYAAARIPEYWIIDPMTRTVTLLVLTGSSYREAVVVTRAGQVSSTVLPELSIDVAECFAAIDRAAPNAKPSAGGG